MLFSEPDDLHVTCRFPSNMLWDANNENYVHKYETSQVHTRVCSPDCTIPKLSMATSIGLQGQKRLPGNLSLKFNKNWTGTPIHTVFGLSRSNLQVQGSTPKCQPGSGSANYITTNPFTCQNKFE